MRFSARTLGHFSHSRGDSWYFTNAKQRLASVLDAGDRSKLAKAMLEDVLQALHFWTRRPPIAVVTSDAYARRLARRFSFEVIEDKNEGESRQGNGLGPVVLGV